MSAWTLGSRVRDKHNGFDGIVIAIARYMYGVTEVLVDPCGLSDGKIRGAEWIRAARLDVAPDPSPTGFLLPEKSRTIARKGRREMNMDANPEMKATDDGYPKMSEEMDAALTAFFTYHPPTEDDKKAYAAINDAALNFARCVVLACPSSPDRTAAIRMIREARMTANASIACKGAKFPH